MKLKHLLLFTILLVLLLCCGISASAEVISGNCGAEGDNLTYTLDTDTGLLEISGTGRMMDYFASDNHPATPWDSYKEFIKTVIVSEGVTNIGDFAFEACSNLQSVELPESLTEFGTATFMDCSSLQSINIPDGVTSLSYAIFSGCSSLRSIDIPEGVTEISNYAFGRCSSLQSITIPEGVWYLEGTFQACSSLQSITIPNNVTFMGYYVFEDCSSLQSVILSENVTEIWNDAFSGCDNLTEVYYPGSEEDWAKIAIKDGNEPLTKARIIFNYVNESISLNDDKVTNDANGFCYSFTMKSKEPVTGVILVAIYQVHELVGLAVEPITEATREFSVTDKEVFTEGPPTHYKMFFWNNLSDVQPLCQSVSGEVF